MRVTSGGADLRSIAPGFLASIPIINTATYLGITLDDKLSFQSHIKLFEGRLSRSLRILKKVKHFHQLPAC